MRHIRKGSHSLVARAIDSVVEEPDSDLALNPCEVKTANCRLSSGVETTFVALTAHWIQHKLQMDCYGQSFQDIVYMPSRRAERKGGFDLSLGFFPVRPRVRTMHKVLYGEGKFNRWCDEQWDWSVTAANRLDREHVRSLLSTYAAAHEFQPFLVLHLCYCIHEYRRMGKVVGSLPIPDFDNLLRTVVVDLRAIVDQGVDWHKLVDCEDFRLSVSKQAPECKPDEDSRAYLGRAASKELFRATVHGEDSQFALPILTLHELYREVLGVIQG